jgi:hypothetical protein
MIDDPLDEQLRDAAREYHRPPPTPRDEMWRAIEARRRSERRTRPPARRWLPWAAAAAAVLALGVGIGRWTASGGRSAPPAAVATAAAPRVNTTAYHLATVEHLGQAEAFLTLFRASLRSGGDERVASATARQLLATNRLLLDSPAGRDPRMRALLEDLELVLAGIAQLASEAGRDDLDLIREGLERGGVLSRLRTAVPAGTTPTQGAL